MTDSNDDDSEYNYCDDQYSQYSQEDLAAVEDPDEQIQAAAKLANPLTVFENLQFSQLSQQNKKRVRPKKSKNTSKTTSVTH